MTTDDRELRDVRRRLMHSRHASADGIFADSLSAAEPRDFSDQLTDEDHALLQAVQDACNKFCLSLSDDRLSHEDHIEMALLFLNMADRILQRMIDTSVDTEPLDIDGDAL